MPDDAARLLILTSELAAPEQLLNYLSHEGGSLADAMATAWEWQDVVADRQRYQVLLLDEISRGELGADALEFALALQHDLKELFPETEALLVNQPAGAHTAALRIGLLRDAARPPSAQELALLMRAAKHCLKIKHANWQCRTLARLRETSELLLSGNHRQEVLERITQIVQESGFDRARLFLLDATGEYLTGVAHQGMDAQFIGVRWPVAEDEHWQELARQPQARIFRRKAGWPTHSETRLDKADVLEWACVPLSLGGKLLGQITADNKFTRRPIHEAELLPLALFACQAASAIEKARQEEFKDLLVNTLPQALLANDQTGQVMIYNQQAEKSLGYTEAEAKGLASVKELYFDPQQAVQVRQRLDSLAAAPLTDFYTELRDKQGQRIPVRLAARRLTDSGGQTLTVGYYEDLRELKKSQERLDLVLHAFTLVAQAQDLTEGLQRLAEMLSQLYPDTFCRILLKVPDQHALRVEAAALRSDWPWKADLREQYDLDKLPKVQQFLEQNEPRIVRRKHPEDVAVLDKLGKKLELPQPIQAVLIIPLKSNNQLVGLLTLGALHEQNEIRREEVPLAVAIATQTTVLIDRLQVDTRRVRILGALQNASQHIQKTNALSFLYSEIARLAANLMGYNVGGLFINQPHLKRLELRAIYGLPSFLVFGVIEHDEGFLGHIARSGKSDWLNDYDKRVQNAGLLGAYNLKTVVGVPLGNRLGEVSAVLFVANTEKRTRPPLALDWREWEQERFAKPNVQELERFGKEAWLALQTALQLDREQRTFKRLTTFHELGDYLQQAPNRQLMLHAVLTCVTANYGLGFNRALVLELNEPRTEFALAQGLGQASEEEAKRLWQTAARRGQNTFARYRETVKDSDVNATSIARRLADWRLTYAPDAVDAFHQVLRQNAPKRIEPAKFDQLPEAFRALFQPSSTVVAVPLFAHEQPVGLLVADRKFSQTPVTEEELSLLVTFSGPAAALLDQAQRLPRNSDQHERAVAFYRRGSELVALQNPKRVLHSIVERLREVAEASAVHLVLVDEFERVEQTITVGRPEAAKSDLMIRPQGISLEVFRRRRAAVFPDTEKDSARLNSVLIGQARSAICLPLLLPGKSLGVVWVHYDQPRQFKLFEVDTLQLYVNQVAIAYDNAHVLEKLGKIREEFARDNDLHRLLDDLNQQALDALRADAVIFWFFDEERGAFDPKHSSAAGLPTELWDKYRQIGHERIKAGATGTVYRLMEKGRLVVTDLTDAAQRAQLGPTTLGLLDEFAACGFQAIALYDGQRKLGVVYALYKQPCEMRGHEHEIAGMLGREAARAWQNVQILDRARNAYQAAEAVARIAGESYSPDTLQKIVTEIQQALAADAVVLFEYHQGKLLPPTAVGVRWPERLNAPAEAQDHPLVLQILALDAPRLVEDVPREPDFRARRFARDEDIRSCLAVPLKAAGQRVGVLFINYRHAHRFAPDELQTARLLAYQVAGALSYLQQLAHSAISHSPLPGREQRERERTMLQELSAAFQRAQTLQETLECAVRQAARELGLDGCTVVLPDQHGSLRVSAQVGWPPAVFNGMVFERGRKSQTGYTIEMGRAVSVKDYNDEPRFEVRPVVKRQMATGVSVPLKRGAETVGAVLGYSRQKTRVFSEEETRLLQLIADQTMLALRGAERYESLQELFKAVHETSHHIATGESDEQLLLDGIVQKAVEITKANPPRTVIASLQRLDAVRNEMILTSIYPLSEAAQSKLGERRSLERAATTDGRIGITGEVVLKKSAQLVGDVRQHPAYWQLHDSTKSELVVPLLHQAEVIGTINVECDQLDAFGDDDLRALQTLADQAVIAIRNGRLIAELKDARQLVNSHTGLAWAGIAGNSWAHIVRRQAANIANQVELLQLRARKYAESLPGWLATQLEVIGREAANIQAQTMPITPPLSAEDASARLDVNELVVERLAQLRQNEPHSPVQLRACPAQPGPLLVNASTEWLRRVLDILIDNALEEARQIAPPRQQVTVSTKPNAGWIEIAVDDLGRGIDPELRPLLFKRRTHSQKGSGVGLLMARAITEAYGGTISLRDKAGPGTQMVIRLPHCVD